jgi:hypothetical protein
MGRGPAAADTPPRGRPHGAASAILFHKNCVATSVDQRILDCIVKCNPHFLIFLLKQSTTGARAAADQLEANQLAAGLLITRHLLHFKDSQDLSTNSRQLAAGARAAADQLEANQLAAGLFDYPSPSPRRQ